ncbi:MAG: prolyl oligopeptidase family serine peptidase [Pirellulales bacterium]|nr:prolyl oligopeptidase family serine peptidase [Pirellulales bacterium]
MLQLVRGTSARESLEIGSFAARLRPRSSTFHPNLIGQFCGKSRDSRPEIGFHSPINRIQRLPRPVLLVHALDDTNVPVGESQDFAEALRQLGRDVTLETVLAGGHDQSMIDKGIPSTIPWFQTREPVVNPSAAIIMGGKRLE